MYYIDTYEKYVTPLHESGLPGGRMVGGGRTIGWTVEGTIILFILLHSTNIYISSFKESELTNMNSKIISRRKKENVDVWWGSSRFSERRWLLRLVTWTGELSQFDSNLNLIQLRVMIFTKWNKLKVCVHLTML